MNVDKRPAWIRLGAAAIALFSAWVAGWSAPALDSPGWQPMFNGRLSGGWEVRLDRDQPAGDREVSPRTFFAVTNLAGESVLRLSGTVRGSLVSSAEFDNFQLRVEYRWGKPGAPRGETRAGIAYWSGTPTDPGMVYLLVEGASGGWEGQHGGKGDVEGVLASPAIAGTKSPPIVFRPGGRRWTIGESQQVLPGTANELSGGWNVGEIVGWGGVVIHRLNQQVALVLINPRAGPEGHEVGLRHGAIQLQSAGAEIFFRRVEIKRILELPRELMPEVPVWQPGEAGFHELFGKDRDDGWRQCGPGEFVLANGVATGIGGMGLWWYTNRMFTNFVLRGEWVQEQEIADSGVFVRFPDPGTDPWVAVHQGHEMEIGDPEPKDPTWRTGSIYPFQASTTANAKPYGQWNSYELVCLGHDYSVRINGTLVTAWTDPGRRTRAGFVGIQNYNDGKTVRHRRFRIKELP